MIPQLQRFFGGAPGWWLAEAPAALVFAFMKMLPRLDAAERIGAISGQAVGSGAMPKSEARGLMRRLEKAARGGAIVRAAKAGPHQLAAMGIVVSQADAGGSDG